MKKVKLGIIVVALGAAAIISFLTGEDQGSIANVDDYRSAWKCVKCEHKFDLTEREAQLAEEKAGGSPIHCAECGKIKAYRLASCLRCGTMFFGPEVPGGSSDCPKCPKHKKPRAEKPDDTTEEEDEQIRREKGGKRAAPKSY